MLAREAGQEDLNQWVALNRVDGGLYRAACVAAPITTCYVNIACAIIINLDEQIQ
ncbi:MAG: hypothetical protein K8R74_17670 [Bacteroidales bacterium]|nr:hypothetical protein [Bacteroidales bacterium]